MKTGIIILCIFACVGCSGDEWDTHTSEIRLDSLSAVLQNAEARIDSLQKIIDAAGKNNNPWFNASIEGRKLQQKGVDSPEAYIKKSLRAQPELIPLQPVLGGTMRFTNIQVLGSHWVIAEYEDGHIMGRTMYEYEVGPNGEIRFSEITSTR